MFTPRLPPVQDLRNPMNGLRPVGCYRGYLAAKKPPRNGSNLVEPVRARIDVHLPHTKCVEMAYFSLVVSLWLATRRQHFVYGEKILLALPLNPPQTEDLATFVGRMHSQRSVAQMLSLNSACSVQFSCLTSRTAFSHRGVCVHFPPNKMGQNSVFTP